MSNPGKAIAGVIVTAAGYVIATAPIPGAAQFAGKMVAAWGFAMLVDGVFGSGDLSAQGSKLSVTSANAPLPVIYGQRRVSHYLADVATHGTSNSWVTQICAICLGGESGKGIEGIQNIYLYNDGATESYIPNPNHTRSVDCQVTGVHASFYKDPDWYYRYNIGKGSTSQTQDPHMADRYPTRWDETISGIANLGGKGIAYCVHGFFYDKDEEDNVWEKGRPVDIQYDVRGALLFDPRYKTAGPDSDGWIWDRADNGSLISTDNHPGQNPALQLLDYLTSKQYGLGIPYASRDGGSRDEIDEQSFIDLAEHCDEPVTTTGLAVNVTLPRYTSNAIVSTGDGHKSNIEMLLAACNAMLVYEGGKFKVIAKKVTTPSSYEITEDEIIGEISFVRDGSSVPNIITVRIPDEEARETPWSWTWPYDAWDYTQNGFLEADNGIFNERNIDLGAVTSRIHGQWLAMLYLREAREDSAMTIKCRESAMQLSVGDVVNVTYDSAGFSQVPFWVVGMEINSDDTVVLHLKEYGGASAYSLDANEDRPTTPDSDLPDPFTVTTPTNVVANCAAGYYLTEGAFIPRVEVTWTHTVDLFAIEEELVYRRDADTEWVFTGIKKKIGDTAVAAWEGDLDIGETYWFGVVAWNRIGVRSAVAETASSCTITGPGNTPSDVSITASDSTCLEGMTISFDNPAVYTEPNSVGVREIGFYSIEIREQGAGATELDRWNNGTHLETVFGTEWNYPFDKMTKGTYDLSLRRFDKYGSPATTPTEVTLTLSEWPCDGFGTGVTIPTIQSQLGYDGSGNGTVTLVINDPQSRVTQVRYDTWPGATQAWSGWQIDAGAPWGPWSVALHEKHDSHIRWEVRYTDPDLGGIFIEGNVTFDVDITPELNSLDINFDESGNATLAYHGDDDVGSIKWATSTSAFPSGATVDANACPTWCNNSRSEGQLSLQAATVDLGDTLYVSIYAYTDIDAGGTKNPFLYQIKRTRISGSDTILPTVQAQITGAGSNEITLIIDDPQSLVNLVGFKKYERGGAPDYKMEWGAWVDDVTDPYTLTTSITRDDKHNSIIGWRVGYDYGGGTKYIENVIVYDLDTVPEIDSVTVNVADNGTVYLSYAGDDDCLSVKYKTSTTDFPDYATTTTTGTVINATSSTNENIGSLSYGETMYVSVAAYPQASGGGTANTDMGWGRTDRYTTGGLSLTAFGGIKDGGNVFFRWGGQGIQSVRYATNIGSAPACPTGGSGGTVNTTKLVGGLGPLLTEQTMYICIVGYSGIGGTGDETDSFTIELRQNEPVVTNPPNQVLYDTVAPVSESGYATGDTWYNTSTAPWTIYGFDDAQSPGSKWQVAQGSYDLIARDGFVAVTPRKTIRFHAGTNTTVVLGDDAINDETDVTINVSGTGFDADTLDTYHAASFPRKAEDADITGAWSFKDNITLDGATTGNKAIYFDAADLSFDRSMGLQFSYGGTGFLHKSVIQQTSGDFLWQVYDSGWSTALEIVRTTGVTDFKFTPTVNGTPIQVTGGLDLGDLGNVTDSSSAAGWYIRSSAAATWVTQSGVPFSDITGTVDADQLGGIAASNYAVLSENETVTGSWTFSDNDINVQNGTDAGFIDYRYGGSTTADKLVWARILDDTIERWAWLYDVAGNTDDLYLRKAGTTEVMRFDYSGDKIEFANRPTVGGTNVALTTDTPTLGALSTHSDVDALYGSGDLLYNASGTWTGQTPAELGLVTNTDISVQGNSSHQGYLGPNDINFINGTNTTVTVTDAGAAITVKVDASLASLVSNTDVDIHIDEDNNGSNSLRVFNGGNNNIFNLDENGDIVMDGDILGGDNVTSTRWNVYNDGTYATFSASNSGAHVQLQASSTTDRFYLYDGTSRNYITPLYGFATGTGGPGAVAANYGAIYLRHEV